MASRPSPRHVGLSIERHCWFLQEEPAMPRRACTQLGAGVGKEAPRDSG